MVSLSLQVRLKTLLEVSAERVALLMGGRKEEQVVIIVSGIIKYIIPTASCVSYVHKDVTIIVIPNFVSLLMIVVINKIFRNIKTSGILNCSDY